MTVGLENLIDSIVKIEEKFDCLDADVSGEQESESSQSRREFEDQIGMNLLNLPELDVARVRFILGSKSNQNVSEKEEKLLKLVLVRAQNEYVELLALISKACLLYLFEERNSF